ncbi:hypothetical protein PV326_003394 [Microctonus aethiopoides]|nr:hypothetical protein PV326_003394 [Microctonus aethiopoides]
MLAEVYVPKSPLREATGFPCGRCNREKPPCKYFHPPQHLKDQLLINGRNHLALKNALMQQMGLTPGQPIVPGQVPTVVCPYAIFIIDNNDKENKTN